MSNRYNGRRQKTTDKSTHKDLVDNRDVGQIRHFTTPRLAHPTVQERESLTETVHVWSTGDRFYKLAHKYYGDSRYWWIIAWWNLRPTEGHLTLGEGVRIPGPLPQVISILKYRNRGGRGGY